MKMENKKYEIIEEREIVINGKTERFGKIRALRDINNLHKTIPAGTEGGWILLKDEPILNVEDRSWVGQGSIVGEGCKIYGEAFVENSRLRGVYVSERAFVKNSEIYTTCGSVLYRAKIIDSEIRITDKVGLSIGGNAEISGSVVDGTRLEMAKYSKIIDCIIEPTGNGIGITIDWEYVNKKVEGTFNKNKGLGIKKLEVTRLERGWNVDHKKAAAMPKVQEKSKN